MGISVEEPALSWESGGLVLLLIFWVTLARYTHVSGF